MRTSLLLYVLLAVLALSAAAVRLHTHHKHSLSATHLPVDLAHLIDTVTSEQLQLNITKFEPPKTNGAGDAINWTTLKPPPKPCKDGSYRFQNSSDCQLVHPVYQVGLADTNLLLGADSLKSLQVKQKLFQRDNPTFKPVICNSAAPHYNGNCIKCTDPTPLFSLASFQCAACPANQVYNSTSRTCVKQEVVETAYPLTNLDASNLILDPSKTLEQQKAEQKKLLDTNTSTFVCKDPTPYSNGKECIACTAENPRFVVLLNTCSKCQNGTYYDDKKRFCVDAPAQMNINPKSQKLIVKDQLAFRESQSEFLLAHPDFKPIACNPSSPYYNGKTCVNCTDPKAYYDISSLACVSCKLYDAVKQQCLDQLTSAATFTNYNNPEATNVIVPANSTFEAELDKSKIEAGKGAQPCPASSPFFDGEFCVSCSGANSLFDLKTKTCSSCELPSLYIQTTKKCVSCKAPETFDNVTQKCANLTFVTDLEAPSLVLSGDMTVANLKSEQEKQKQQNPNLRVCPTLTPYFNGTGCQKCSDQSKPFFDMEAKKCRSCETYNSSNLRCIIPPGPQNHTVLSAPGIIVPQNSTMETQQAIQDATMQPGSKPCPAGNPFFNGIECINCTDVGFFNLGSKSCVPCSRPNIYINSTKKCVKAQFISNLTAGKIIVGEKETLSEVQQNVADQMKSNPNLVPCPAATPYFSGTECISCPQSTPYFDWTSKKCIACSNYSEKLSKCLKVIIEPTPTTKVNQTQHYSNLEATDDWVSTSGSKVQIQYALNKTKSSLISCPKNNPFSTGHECINCPKDNYFDMDKLACVSLPTGKKHDPNVHKFMTPETNKYTDRNAQNIDYSGYSSEDVDNYFTPAKGATKCPLNAPYYDGIACVPCEQPRPIFDIDTQRCKRCNQGEVWVEDNHSCESADATKAAWSTEKALGSVLGS